MRLSIISLFIVLAVSLVSCSGSKSVPADSSDSDEEAVLMPDYNDVVIPSNIAPLNFSIRSDGSAFAVKVKGKSGEIIASVDDRTAEFDIDEWHSLVGKSQGEDLEVSVYCKRNGSWIRLKPFRWTVAEEIDPYLSYRLIEPGYEAYRQLGLYQRNLENFDVTAIYENNREFSKGENHCINCHNYQGYSAKRMLFHVRGNMGGTLIADENGIEKMDMKTDSTLAAAVYPSWHPSKPLIIFSSNRTGQTFHLLNDEKTEVYDIASDLILYDVKNHTVSNVIKTDDALETFPCWSPSGDRVYYCCADTKFLENQTDSARWTDAMFKYNQVRYNVMSIAYNDSLQTFSDPRVEVDCASMMKSAAVPRISPDGRYLVYTSGDYGQFHIWHKSSDLWVKDLETDSIYSLGKANSADADSYHTFSSNGKWIVFSSRRDDGSYSRPYITHFKDGQSSKAFMLPQKDPMMNVSLLKSYNVPELTKDAVTFTPSQFKDAIYNQKGRKVEYKPAARQ